MNLVLIDWFCLNFYEKKKVLKNTFNVSYLEEASTNLVSIATDSKLFSNVLSFLDFHSHLIHRIINLMIIQPGIIIRISMPPCNSVIARSCQHIYLIWIYFILCSCNLKCIIFLVCSYVHWRKTWNSTTVTLFWIRKFSWYAINSRKYSWNKT